MSKLSLAQVRTKRKNLYLKEVINSTFFIGFAFANYFLPFFICLIAGATKTPYAPEYVVGIGLATSFMVVIFQFSAILAMTLSFGEMIYRNQKKLQSMNKSEIFTLQLFITVVVGIFLVPLYIGFSYLYMYFCGAFANTREAVCNFGLNFLLSSSPSMLFTSINTYLIYQVFFRKHNNWLALLLVFINLFINTLTVGLFGYYLTNINTFSYGIGLCVGNIICLVINYLVINSMDLIYPIRINFHIKSFMKILQKISVIAFVNLYIVILKSIMILAVGLSLHVNEKDSPWNYLISKIIWYNALYLIGFFNAGLMQQISYLGVKNYQDSAKFYNDALKFCWLIPLVTAVAVTAMVVGFGYLVDPLANLYASNAAAGSGIVGSGQPGSIAWFITMPNNRTYLWTAVFLVLVAFSTSLGVLTPVKVFKSKKEKTKENLTTIISATLVLIFIIAFGCGIHSNHFQYMEVFACGLVIIGAVFCALKLLGFLSALKNNVKLYGSNFNKPACEQPKVVSGQAWNIKH